MEALKAELKKLQTQRSAIEADINSRSERLNEPGQPGISGILLDKEVHQHMCCTAEQHAAA
jgi:26S proteasome non-ATPase regulatory subunit 9